MTKLTTKLLVSITFASSMLLSAQVVQAKPSFYKCQSGYTFKINNAKTGARCEVTRKGHVKPISCPSITVFGKSVGTFPQKKRGKDRCAGRGVASVETSHDPLACSSGYSYKRDYRGTADKCVKANKLEIKAPTVKFR